MEVKTGMVQVKKIIVRALLLILFLLPPLGVSDYFLHLFILSAIFVSLVLGANLLMGYTGLIHVGHAAFWGIGAYVAALSSKHLGTSFWMNLPISALLTGVTGALFGIITTRMGGVYLAICTFAFNLIVYQVLGNWRAVTGGYIGITGIPSPHIPIIDFTFSSKASNYYLILSIVMLNIYFFNRLILSKTGRALKAIRGDEIASKAMGINTFYYKTLAFAIAAFMAGIAGTLYAHYILFVSPDTFVTSQSIFIQAMAIIGGLGTITGSIIGAVFLTISPEILRSVGESRMLVYGSLLLLTIVFFPGGIVGLGKKVVTTFRKE